MSKPRVLLDTNILISGIVFSGGNEHKILKLAESRDIVLVLPDFVIKETEQIMRQRFTGYEALLDIFLSKVDYVNVPWSEFKSQLFQCKDRIRDKKDAPLLAVILVRKPEYAITGDKNLREDIQACAEADETRICTSRKFLEEFLKKS